MADKKNTPDEKDKKNPLAKPDPETLHTTDPQDEMEGPVSSVMQNIKDEADENEERDKNDKSDPEKWLQGSAALAAQKKLMASLIRT